MNEILERLQHSVKSIIEELYEISVPKIEFQSTRKEFDGDVTLVVFPFVRASKKGPEQTAQEIGEKLINDIPEFTEFNVVKGFLNLSIDADIWAKAFEEAYANVNFGRKPITKDSPISLVEYSSPNTNKPLHLGHIRNNLLGYSVSQILKAAGEDVKMVQIINDRGIHICKSMIAWLKFANGETPEQSGLKGDKLVGKYYVAFDKAYREEMESLIAEGVEKEEAAKKAPIMLEAQALLRKWEAQDPETVALWERMNGWVYDGFDITYKKLGVSFDKNYYESDTYILGKADIQKGLEEGVFYQKEDQSVWIDLSEEGLDEKLVLRGDGTAVYMTQDIGTAIQRFKDFQASKCVYVVGNEQDYHFKVLFLILAKLGYDWAKQLYHLSYGMVDLPSGKMKSREGTVVDADDLVVEMEQTAAEISEELGKTEGLSSSEKEALYHTIGMGALKYFILKVDPKKRMMFNPQESIDFNGNTGPFIQYTHARIQSLKRKGSDFPSPDFSKHPPKGEEKALMKSLLEFESVVDKAAKELSPAVVANYVFDLVKQFNGYYQNHVILNTEEPMVSSLRLGLSDMVGRVVNTGMSLLGIDCPDRM